MPFKLSMLALFAGSFAPVSFAADEPSLPKSAVFEELVVSEFRQTPATDVNTSLTQLNEGEIEEFSLQHFEEPPLTDMLISMMQSRVARQLSSRRNRLSRARPYRL